VWIAVDKSKSRGRTASKQAWRERIWSLLTRRRVGRFPLPLNDRIPNFAGSEQAALFGVSEGGPMCAVFAATFPQRTSALVMYGKIPRVTAPEWIGGLHKWSGRIAFLLAVPVAIHCLYALGFQQYNTRVLIHSVVGCLFFGAFAVKMLILPKRGLPGWVLPVVGAVVFTLLVVIWLTSAYWFFSTFGIKR